MLNLNIAVTGKTWTDVEIALNIILNKIEEEQRSGSDSTKDSSYNFNVSGEEE